MKYTNDSVLDAALDKIATATIQTACTQQPTSRTEAVTTFALSSVATAGGDFTKANGDFSGRKITLVEKSGVSVTGTGMHTHTALCDGTDLLHVTYANLTRANTAQAGGASTITLDAAASANDNEYTSKLIVITGGTGYGQERTISGYVGSTKVATVSSAWSTVPDSSSTFSIYGQALTSGNTMTFSARDVVEFADVV